MKLNTVIFCVMFAALIRAEYHGILINGFNGGTQLYDPFSTPHAQGNLKLGLQTASYGDAAVINGHLVYFASGDAGAANYKFAYSTRRQYTAVSLQGKHHLSSTTQRKTLRAYWRRCRKSDMVTA